MARTRWFIVVMLAALAASGCAFLTRSSVASAPAQTQADAASRAPSISAHGRFVAFESDATNLVPGDTNGVADVFVRDNVAHTTERVSVTANGTQLTSASSGPSISGDGRYVAFATKAALDATDTGVTNDIYVKDRRSGAVARASSDNTEGCDRPVLSGDGRTIAFECFYTFIIPRRGSYTVPEGPIVRHLDTGATVAGLHPPDPLGYSEVEGYALSSDGATAVSSWSGVYTGGVAIADTKTGTILHDIRHSYAGPVALSADGTRYAYFANDGDAVDPGTLRVAATDTPEQYLLDEKGPRVVDLSMSADGTLLGALVELGSGHTRAARRHADGSDDWAIVSRTADAARQIKALDAEMSSDGEWFAFSSTDANVVSGDTNGVADVFTRSIARNSPPPTPA